MVDAAVLSAVTVAVGAAAVGDPVASARLRLLARMYGGGLRCTADVFAATFVDTV